MSLAFYFFFSSLFFWFFHILRRTLFYLYFGQLKEYRIDRIIDGMRENRRILLPRNSVIALIFFIFSLPILKIPYVFETLFFIFYFFLACYSLNLILKKDYPLPKFTKKMILLLIFILFLEMLFILNFYSSSDFFRIILIFEVTFPIFIFLSIIIFQLPTAAVKNILIHQARNKIKRIKNLTVLGITGSYGKTSTKEFLAKLLEEKFKILKTEGNRNSEMGVVETILSWPQKIIKSDEVKIFICEMGAYRKGEIKAICNIVHPKIGILTGINEQHISLFGNLRNIINTKFELISSLPKGGVAVFNGNNKECLKLYQRCQVKKYLYSAIGEDSDIFAKEIKEEKDFLSFKVAIKNKGEEKVRLNLLGRQNVENFLGATFISILLGVSLNKIKERALKITPSPTAMVKKKGKGGVAVIDDSYSQNPDGVISAIDYSKIYQGKKIIIMPCLIELGRSAPSVHKNVGRRIGEVFDLAIVTTPYYFEELKLGVIESGMKKEQILYLNYPSDIYKKIKPYFEKENVILIEGRVNEQIKGCIGIQ